MCSQADVTLFQTSNMKEWQIFLQPEEADNTGRTIFPEMNFITHIGFPCQKCIFPSVIYQIIESQYYSENNYTWEKLWYGMNN